MSIKGVLFDKDGVLIDVNGTWLPTYREILAEQFPGEAEAKLAMAGLDSATDRFRSGSTLAGGTTRGLVDIWWPGLSDGEAVEKVELLDVGYRAVAQKHLKELLPLAPILTQLRRRGLRLGVATNDSAVSARHQLEELGAADLIDAIIGVDTVARPKPAGDMVARFGELMAIEPRQIAMIGDNPHDMAAARAGGAGLAIAVLSGNSERDDIAHLADHVLGSIADLPALLASL